MRTSRKRRTHGRIGRAKTTTQNCHFCQKRRAGGGGGGGGSGGCHSPSCPGRRSSCWPSSILQAYAEPDPGIGDSAPDSPASSGSRTDAQPTTASARRGRAEVETAGAGRESNLLRARDEYRTAAHDPQHAEAPGQKTARFHLGSSGFRPQSGPKSRSRGGGRESNLLRARDEHGNIAHDPQHAQARGQQISSIPPLHLKSPVPFGAGDFIAEADGNRTRQGVCHPLNGFEDRGTHQAS